MSQLKQNNLSCLDSLAALPGEAPPDKSLAWQKLEPRLHKKEGVLKTWWYWRAAAAVLLVFGTMFIPTKNDLRPGGELVSAPVTRNGSVLSRKNIVTILPVSPSEKGTEEFTAMRTDPAPPIAAIKIQHRDSGITFIAPAVTKVVIRDSPGVCDTAAMASVIPVQKKMRIVNVNELDDADRFVSKNLPRTDYTGLKKAAKGYAGTINFRIYLKN